MFLDDSDDDLKVTVFIKICLYDMWKFIIIKAIYGLNNICENNDSDDDEILRQYR